MLQSGKNNTKSTIEAAGAERYRLRLVQKDPLESAKKRKTPNLTDGKAKKKQKAPDDSTKITTGGNKDEVKALNYPHDLGGCVRGVYAKLCIPALGQRSLNRSERLNGDFVNRSILNLPSPLNTSIPKKTSKVKCDCAEYELKCREIGERIMIEFFGLMRMRLL
jgi:hypothetical protein